MVYTTRVIIIALMSYLYQPPCLLDIGINIGHWVTHISQSIILGMLISRHVLIMFKLIPTGLGVFPLVFL